LVRDVDKFRAQKVTSEVSYVGNEGKHAVTLPTITNKVVSTNFIGKIDYSMVGLLFY